MRKIDIMELSQSREGARRVRQGYTKSQSIDIYKPLTILRRLPSFSRSQLKFTSSPSFIPVRWRYVSVCLKNKSFNSWTDFSSIITLFSTTISARNSVSKIWPSYRIGIFTSGTASSPFFLTRKAVLSDRRSQAAQDPFPIHCINCIHTDACNLILRHSFLYFSFIHILCVIFASLAAWRGIINNAGVFSLAKPQGTRRVREGSLRLSHEHVLGVALTDYSISILHQQGEKTIRVSDCLKTPL